jgi:hypothetical protein
MQRYMRQTKCVSNERVICPDCKMLASRAADGKLLPHHGANAIDLCENGRKRLSCGCVFVRDVVRDKRGAVINDGYVEHCAQHEAEGPI